VIPAPFDYARAESASHALALLAEHGDEAKLLAGGHSLLPMMKLRLAVPSVLVDIGQLTELAGIALDGDDLVIGATTRHAEVAGSDLVVANVDGTLLAYHDRCANCGSPLHEGLLSAGALACPECRRSFFLPRAGRSLDDEQMQLEPVPLLRDEGRVKVALTQ